MAGTIPLSMTQQMDQYGDPLDGGRLYFFVAGTVSTPQNAYQDITLTNEHPNPIILDATGRVPQLFLADGLIKIRLTDAAGVVQLSADNVQVVGSSSGSVTGGTIDATTIAQTGDLKPRYGTGTHTGWVRCNANTIGNSGSSATELAHDLDALALFEYLWNIDSNLAVSGGRGANAAADFAAGKRLTLPDARGRGFAGLDGMGNSVGNAGRLTASYFGTAATVLGAVGGDEKHLLTEAQLPVVDADVSIGDEDNDHTHFLNNIKVGDVQSGIGASVYRFESGSIETGGSTEHHRHSVVVSSGGGGNHNNTPPTMVVTIYIKL
jgi:microcystin-dependent protein